MGVWEETGRKGGKEGGSLGGKRREGGKADDGEGRGKESMEGGRMEVGEVVEGKAPVSVVSTMYFVSCAIV